MSNPFTIWKFPLAITDIQEAEMPHGAKILHVDNQDGIPTMWAEVDTRQVMVKRIIAVVGTGNPMSDAAAMGNHVGSVLMPPFVWHIYDCGED